MPRVPPRSIGCGTRFGIWSKAIGRNYAPLFDSIDEMLDDILTDSNVIVNLSDLRSHDGYTFGHSVNVAAMSLLIGHDLGLDVNSCGRWAWGRCCTTSERSPSRADVATAGTAHR